MKKQEFNISCTESSFYNSQRGIEIKTTKGYFVKYGGYYFGIHKTENKFEATELTTGFKMPETDSKTIKETIRLLRRVVNKRKGKMKKAIADTEKYLRKSNIKPPVNDIKKIAL